MFIRPIQNELLFVHNALYNDSMEERDEKNN